MNSNITLLFTGKNISEKRRNRSINSSLIDLFFEEKSACTAKLSCENHRFLSQVILKYMHLSYSKVNISIQYT